MSFRKKMLQLLDEIVDKLGEVDKSVCGITDEIHDATVGEFEK